MTQAQAAALVQVMPDDHSKSVPPLPIPNRTVKRLCADDSAATSVKVGYRQACFTKRLQLTLEAFCFALPISPFGTRQNSLPATALPTPAKILPNRLTDILPGTKMRRTGAITYPLLS